mgnify:CR=1 FL=1
MFFKIDMLPWFVVRDVDRAGCSRCVFEYRSLRKRQKHMEFLFVVFSWFKTNIVYFPGVGDRKLFFKCFGRREIIHGKSFGMLSNCFDYGKKYKIKIQ